MNHLCYFDSVEKAKIILSKGIESLEQSMLIAINFSRKKMINLLIENGMKEFEECLLESCFHSNIELVKFFISKGAKNFNSAFQSFINSKNGNYIEISDILIEKINLNSFFSFNHKNGSSHHKTPLMIYTLKSNPIMLIYLLSNGADPKITDKVKKK